MRRFPHRTLILGLALAWALALPALPAMAAEHQQAADDVTPAEAEERLATLTRLLRSSKSTTLDLTDAIDGVAEAYATAGKDARARDAYRKQADVQLVKALARWKAPRDRRAEGNLHEEVAIRAAKALGDVAAHLDAKARKSLFGRVRAYVDGGQFKNALKHGVSGAQLDATFAAIGHIGAPEALPWYEKQFMRTDLRLLPVLVAAHKSLVLFKDVPGKLRHMMVDELITNYASVETQAQQGNTVAERSAKRFWDELKLHTIPALQHFAGKPTNEDGEALATVAAFRVWFREHKRVNRAPWTDES